MTNPYKKALTSKVEKQEFQQLRDLEIQQWQLLIDKALIEEGNLEDFFIQDKDSKIIAPFLQTDDEEILALNKKVIQKREFLIKSNMGFVFSRAEKFYGNFLALEDRIQDGVEGLIKAINRFDVNKGYKFITYASQWINNAIRRQIHYTELTVRVPTPARSKGITTLTHSIDSVIANDDEGNEYSYADFLCTEEDDHIMLDWDKVELLYNNLSERDRYIIKRRLYTDDPLTLKEIGDQFGITRERIRQRQEASLTTLRNKLNIKI